jgi:hypothetical protein
VKKPWPLPERRDYIGKIGQTQNPSETYSLPFPNSFGPMKVYSVSIDFPVYRLGNGRTLASQKEYIAKKGKDSDFFTRDPESYEALMAQDEILQSMVHEKKLLERFEDLNNVQTEPFLLDENGYIVNGNRRLCAFKILLQKDFKKYDRYNYIKVVFLPHLEKIEEIDKIEAQLQIIQDIKAEYSWTAKAILFKDKLVKYGLSYEYVASLYDLKESDIIEYRDMLEYADEYLISRDKKEQYSGLIKDEYAFRTLVKNRKKVKDLDEQKIFKEIVFKMIDNSREAGERIYKRISDVQKNLPELTSSLKEHYKIKSEPFSEKIEIAKNSDLLTPIYKSHKDNPEKKTIYEELEKDTTNKSFDVIIEKLDDIRYRQIEDDKQSSFLDNLERAVTNLIDAKNHFDSLSDINGAEEYLNQIINHVKEIKKLIIKK